MINLPRSNTKTIRLLQYIGSKNGVRYMDIERFICEMSGYDYDRKVSAIIWDSTGFGRMALVRRYKGIWGTNLCSGSKPILYTYCVKGKDKLWRLKASTFNALLAHDTKDNELSKSSLESKEFQADEILNNSKVVNTRIISPVPSLNMNTPLGVIMTPAKTTLEIAISKLQIDKETLAKLDTQLDQLVAKRSAILDDIENSVNTIKQILEI